MGPDAATHASHSVLPQGEWHLCVSSGFAGALCPCHVGALAVPHDVLAVSDTVPAGVESRVLCDRVWRHQAWKVACAVDSRSVEGTMVTAPFVLATAADKREHADRTHAVAADMESAALGRVAKAQGIPFVVVRAISDLVDEDLPVDFNLFLKPGGWCRGVRQVLGNPQSWGRFGRLQRQASLAASQLTRFFQKFFDEAHHTGLVPRANRPGGGA